jgi:hypothetical protein
MVKIRRHELPSAAENGEEKIAQRGNGREGDGVA